jgi:hypothetical protein
MFFNVPSFAVGFVSGFGTGFFTREWARFGQATLRPMAKAAIRSGILAVEKSRDALAMAGETLEDLIAEARSEMRTEAGAQAVGSGEHATIVARAADENRGTHGHDEHRAKAKKGHG